MVVSLPCQAAIPLSYFGFSDVYHFAYVWPTALNLAVTNFDMLFLVMGVHSLVNEIQFMLISSLHICIRSRYNDSAIPC